jgi:Tfp pilus assembly protein PilF
VLRLRAERLASEGRCEEALGVVRRAREADPGDARAALLEGECLIRERRYGDAVAPLEDARRSDPALAEATLYLGIARYHVGDLEAAQRELEQASQQLPRNAEAQLYLGLVLLEQARADEAAVALELAADLDPDTIDPAASYYAGRAWQIARQRDRAEGALRHAMQAAPGSPWALEAERALAGSRERYRKRGAWVSLAGGIEYDSNVVLRGSGVLLPDEISDEEDWRGVWRLRGGTELYRDATWAVGARVDYYGTAQFDLDDFDTQFPTLTVWLDRSLGEDTYLRVQPDFGFAWLGYDPYLLATGATVSLYHDWGTPGTGMFFGSYQYRDYRFDVTASVLDRDGNRFEGGYEHRYPLGSSTVLRGGVSGGHYGADGREYTFSGVSTWVDVRQLLPLDLVLEARFRYAHAWYRDASVFSPSGRERRDDLYVVEAGLERRITENVILSGRYRYENDDSNVGVYDYDRHIAGGYVTIEFGDL